MNGTKHNLAAIETLPQSVGTGPSSLGAFCRQRNAAELFAPKTRAVEYCRRQWERIIASAAATGRAPQRFFMSENANDLEKENSRCECSWNW